MTFSIFVVTGKVTDFLSYHFASTHSSLSHAYLSRCGQICQVRINHTYKNLNTRSPGLKCSDSPHCNWKEQKARSFSNHQNNASLWRIITIKITIRLNVKRLKGKYEVSRLRCHQATGANALSSLLVVRLTAHSIKLIVLWLFPYRAIKGKSQKRPERQVWTSFWFSEPNLTLNFMHFIWKSVRCRMWRWKF